MDAIFEVAIIAIAYALFTVAVQRHPKITNRKRMYEIQNRVKAVSEEMNKMVKNGASKEEIMAKQKEIMPLLSESMKGQFKSLFIVFPVLIVIYYLFLPMAFPSNLTVNFLSINLGYKTFFIVISFIVAFPLSLVFMVVDKKRYGRLGLAPQQPQQQPTQSQ